MPGARRNKMSTCLATERAGKDAAGARLQALRQQGFMPALRHSACGYTAPGIGIRLSLASCDSNSLSRAWELSRIRALLFARCAVTLSIDDADAFAAGTLERLLRHLHRASSAPCIDRRQLGVALPCRGLPLPAYLLMSRIWLGNGPRYVILDDNPDRSAAQQAMNQALFSTLYQQRLRRRTLCPVYAIGLRSRCALLPDERGTSISAPFALVGPADSAWLPVPFNLCRFSDSRGRIREAALHAGLRSALRHADALFDYLHWPDSRQRSDARENRRIAFLPLGIGDLVALRHEDPSSIGCLRRLDRLFAGIHETLWQESRRLALERGLLPALAARDPVQQLPGGARSQHWRDRLKDALAQAAVRHRNLLVISPYALLPQNGAAGTGFSDLLPLLGYADALGFAGGTAFAGWRIDEFRAFHQRAAAILRRRNAATFVATGV